MKFEVLYFLYTFRFTRSKFVRADSTGVAPEFWQCSAGIVPEPLLYVVGRDALPNHPCADEPRKVASTSERDAIIGGACLQRAQ